VPENGIPREGVLGEGNSFPKMVSRSFENLPLIFKQYKLETGNTQFDFNAVIKWLGDCKFLIID